MDVYKTIFMKKVLFIVAFAATGLASISAQEKLKEEGGNECPDMCKTDDGICCDTPGGSTYYGRIY